MLDVANCILYSTNLGVCESFAQCMNMLNRSAKFTASMFQLFVDRLLTNPGHFSIVGDTGNHPVVASMSH